MALQTTHMIHDEPQVEINKYKMKILPCAKVEAVVAKDQSLRPEVRSSDLAMMLLALWEYPHVFVEFLDWNQDQVKKIQFYLSESKQE